MTIDDARENFMSDVYNTLDFLPTNNEANRIIDSFDRVTSGLNQQSCEDWYDVPSDEMTFEQARQAVKDLRKKLAEYLDQDPCENAVSRKAAIDIIESWLSCDDYNEAERHIMRAMQSVLYDLPPVTPKEKTGWIPVSERLPEECSGVLVYCPENENIFLAYWEIGKWYIFSPRCDEPIDEPIVAWMPLPEPPMSHRKVRKYERTERKGLL